jgi:hypothetical protein
MIHRLLAIALLATGCQATTTSASAPTPDESAITPPPPPPADPSADSPAPAKKAPERAGEFRWDVPEGWRTEVIPFPLPFAPNLPYRGAEELRFPPGFLKVDSENFWSYAFIWWLEGDEGLKEAELESAFTAYFKGLSEAVSNGKYPMRAERFKTDLKKAPSILRKDGSGATTYRGTAETYDAFRTGKELTLNVELRLFDCTAQKRKVVYASVSPKPEAHEVWAQLRALEATFECGAAKLSSVR